VSVAYVLVLVAALLLRETRGMELVGVEAG
jgi:hypothetical protein